MLSNKKALSPAVGFAPSTVFPASILFRLIFPQFFLTHFYTYFTFQLGVMFDLLFVF